MRTANDVVAGLMPAPTAGAFGMAPKVLRHEHLPRSVIIPDKRSPSQRLDSIAAIQRRLQEKLDEGRLLRRQLEEVPMEIDFPLTREADGDPRLRKISRERGQGRRKSD